MAVEVTVDQEVAATLNVSSGPHIRKMEERENPRRKNIAHIALGERAVQVIFHFAVKMAAKRASVSNIGRRKTKAQLTIKLRRNLFYWGAC